MPISLLWIWFMFNRYAFSLFRYSIPFSLLCWPNVELLCSVNVDHMERMAKCVCILPKMAENNTKEWHQFVYSLSLCVCVRTCALKIPNECECALQQYTPYHTCACSQVSKRIHQNLLCWSAGILNYNWNGSKLSCFPFNSLNDS